MSNVLQGSETSREGSELVENSSENVKSMLKVARKIKIGHNSKIVRVIESLQLDEKNFKLDLWDIRVLKIEEVAKIQHFYQILNKEHFLQALQKSTHCFIICAEVSEADLADLEKIAEQLTELNFGSRPLIIKFSIFSLKVTRIFFKHEDENEFTKITDDSVSAANIADFNFETLLKVIETENHGDIDFADISSVKIDISKKYGEETLAEHAIIAQDTLSLRLLNLFTDSFDFVTTQLALVTGDHKVLSAYLDMPMIHRNYNLKRERLMNHFYQSLDIVELEKFLCYSAKYGETQTLEFLINSLSDEVRQELKLTKICDSAADDRNVGKIQLLLQNDFPFPTNIDEIESPELASTIKEREIFHKAIQNCARDTVEQFILANPKIKIGFNKRNFSAMACALKHGRKIEDFEIYSLLMYHHFHAPNDALHASFFKNLSNKDKENITKDCAKFYGKPVDSHIFYIYSKSRMGTFSGDQQEENFHKIKIYLEKLNQIPEIAPLLKVVENSEMLSLNFDFLNNAAHKMDLMSSQATTGVCYNRSGRIYIGAKSSDVENLGTLSHELCHYAMKIIFQNDCKPYHENDVANLEEFAKIVNECESYDDNDPIVHGVFDSYPQECFHDEIVVRIPHMLAFYQDDQAQIDQLRIKYKNLFEFYEKNVIGKIQTFLRDPKKFAKARKVQETNDKLGGFKSIEFCKKKPINIKTSKIQLIVSNLPQLAKSCVIQELKKTKSMADVKSSIIFAKATDFENEYFLQCLENAADDEDMSFYIICECNNRLDVADELWTFISETDAAFSIICSEEQVETFKRKLKKKFFEEQTINFTWSDLGKEQQDSLLTKEINFQNQEIKLNDLIGRNSILENLPLGNLFDDHKIFSIGEAIPMSKGYDESFYIKRDFRVVDEFDETLTPTMEMPDVELLDDATVTDFVGKDNISLKYYSIDLKKVDALVVSKVVMIADDAGKGKSITSSHLAKRMKEKFPELWVIRIDLNQYIESFKFLFTEDVKSFILTNFVKPRNHFEQLLFKEHFRNSKVVIILDGLDEIAPLHATTFFEFLKKLEKSSIRKVYVASRRHLKPQMAKNVAATYLKLESFSREDQINFLTKFWQKCVKTRDHESLNKYAVKVIEQFQNLPEKQTELIGIPLQTRMIAEIFTEDVSKFLNCENLQDDHILPNFPSLTSLYEEFITRKIMIVQSEKGDLVGREKAENEREGISMMKIYEKFAYAEVFGVPVESDLDPNVIQRYGIMSLLGGKIEFLHRTFAEYLVASSVVKKLDKSEPEIEEKYFYQIIFGSYSRWNLLYLLELLLKSRPEISNSEIVHRKIAEFIDENAFKEEPDGIFFIHRMLYQRLQTMIEFMMKCVKYSNLLVQINLGVRIVAEGWNILSLATVLNLKEAVKALLPFGLRFPPILATEDIDNLNAFQLSFLKDFFDPSEESIPEILYEAYSTAFASEAVSWFITGWHYTGELKNGFKLPNIHVESFRHTLDLRWKIARAAIKEKTEKEILTSNNLFTGGLKLVMDEGDVSKIYQDEIFRWISRKLEGEEESSNFRKFIVSPDLVYESNSTSEPKRRKLN